jgi:hypothetical protein
MLIFEYLIPNLMGPMIAKSGFRETKLYEFITRKYGGKDIGLPDIVDPGKPNDPFDGEKPNDPNNHNNNENLKDNNTGNDENLKDNNSDNTSGNNSENNQSEDLTNDNQRLENDEFWKVAFKKYDNDVIEKIRPFGEDGKALIEIYEKEGRIDEIIDIINKLPEEDVEQGIHLMIDYLDDAVELLKNGESVESVKALFEFEIKAGHEIISHISKIEYGNDSLSRAAIEYRKNNRITSPRRNVCSIEYIDLEGKIVQKSFCSNNSNHAEEIMINYLKTENIPGKNLIRLFTEREPCVEIMTNLGHNCTMRIVEYSPNVEVTYAVDYGINKSDGLNARIELKKILEKLLE